MLAKQVKKNKKVDFFSMLLDILASSLLRNMLPSESKLYGRGAMGAGEGNIRAV